MGHLVPCKGVILPSSTLVPHFLVSNLDKRDTPPHSSYVTPFAYSNFLLDFQLPCDPICPSAGRSEILLVGFLSIFFIYRHWGWFSIIQKTRPLIGVLNVEEEIRLLEDAATQVQQIFQRLLRRQTKPKVEYSRI